MNPSIYVAVIGAIAALLTAAITYSFTKRREREADWRKLKLEMYREFTDAMAAIVGPGASSDDIRRFNVSANSLHLIASKRAIDALGALRYELSGDNPNPDKSNLAHDKLLAHLFWEIRCDLGDVPTVRAEEFKVKFYASGKPK